MFVGVGTKARKKHLLAGPATWRRLRVQHANAHAAVASASGLEARLRMLLNAAVFLLKCLHILARSIASHADANTVHSTAAGRRKMR